MRCSQVSQIIDESAARRLGTAERRAVEAHCGGCADCASAWRAHQTLLRQAIPPLPPHLLNMLVAVGAGSPGRV